MAAVEDHRSTSSMIINGGILPATTLSVAANSSANGAPKQYPKSHSQHTYYDLTEREYC